MKKINTILLIDDDHITQYISKRLITRLNLCDHVKTAVNGVEAIRYLNSIYLEEFPALILLDINMPVMDGFEFLVNLSALYPIKIKEIKIYLLTSSTSTKDLKRMEEFSCISGYINKPLTEEKLLAYIQP